MVDVARVADDGAPDRHSRLVKGLTDLYARSLAEHGWQGDRHALMHWLGVDIALNAQGLGVWLDRERQKGDDGSKH
jgi:hypothetical protein